MKNSTFVASALSALYAGGLPDQDPKVVENPLIESANSMTLDIAKVELTDTATVLHVDAYFPAALLDSHRFENLSAGRR